jgi:hypothetical protein
MTQHQLIPQDSRIKKRRSQRLALSVPVVVYRIPNAGRHFFEGAHTLAVSAHGALIGLGTEVAADQTLVLKHALTGEEQACRVIFVQKKSSGRANVGIEFREPAPNFWGIAFPPSDWKQPA